MRKEVYKLKLYEEISLRSPEKREMVFLYKLFVEFRHDAKPCLPALARALFANTYIKKQETQAPMRKGSDLTRYEGRTYILFAAILWGVSYFLRKLIVHEINPFLFTFLIALITSIFLITIGAASPRKCIETFKKHPWHYLGLSFLGSVLGGILMLKSLQLLDLAVVTLLEKLQPLFVVLLLTLFFKESVPKSVYPYIALALISSYFVSLKNPWVMVSETQAWGIVYIVLAALVWSISTLLGKKLVHATDSVADLIVIRFGLAVCILLPFMLSSGSEIKTIITEPSLMITLLILGVGCTIAPYLLYYKGLQRTSAITASFLELLTPIVSLTLALVFLKESYSITQLIAIPILLYSVYKISKLTHIPTTED